MPRIILLSGFVEPLGLTEENTGADAVIAKSVNEPAHLVRSVKRLMNRGTAQAAGVAEAALADVTLASRRLGTLESVTLESWCSPSPV